MTRMILVRHGETPANAEHRVHGQTNTPLNPTGREQARRVAARLATEPVAAVYSSDLDRAYETASLIAQAHHLTVTKVPGLREIHLGDYEDLVWSEVMELDADFHTGFHEALPDWRAPGGESVREVQERVAQALSAIAARHPDETTVVVAHGGALGYVLCQYLGGDFRDCLLPNTGFSVLEFSPEGVKVISHKETGHLPPK